ncbi:hypothetical protein [Escherichia coli]|uniref:hypothetical protein n=1 Tax=Escherichia coli TaxID=562 RepID=UPI0010120B85|nr:hypothetical protein [Escherichia coli]EKU3279530.1 hypothetical protein [Escherichia coli]ELG9945979.1 hypothetical protein [Escherichia coli]ELG9962665.1 hypothetical protein [Escherichia coli]ELQ7383757.1 hypothetical protein [Escherichia coli]MBS9666038.1 hypothetical protein [Escherichia coli]
MPRSFLDLCNLRLLVVILVVLTASQFRFSLLISHLKAKAIPVRGAKFKKACFLAGFCFLITNALKTSVLNQN